MASAQLLVGVLLLATGVVLSAPQNFGLLQGIFGPRNPQTGIFPMFRPQTQIFSNFGQFSRPQGQSAPASFFPQLSNLPKIAMNVFEQIVANSNAMASQLQQAQQQFAMLSNLAQTGQTIATEGTQGEQQLPSEEDIAEALLEITDGGQTLQAEAPDVEQKIPSLEDVAEVIEKVEAEQAVQSATTTTPEEDQNPLPVQDIAEALLEISDVEKTLQAEAPVVEQKIPSPEDIAEVIEKVEAEQAVQVVATAVAPEEDQNPLPAIYNIAEGILEGVNGEQTNQAEAPEVEQKIPSLEDIAEVIEKVEAEQGVQGVATAVAPEEDQNPLPVGLQDVPDVNNLEMMMDI